VQAFLHMIHAALPGMLELLAPARLWTGQEMHIEKSFYQRIPSVNFSQQVLSAKPERLITLRLQDVGWSDLGDPGRAFTVARKSSCESVWVQNWAQAKA